MKVDRTKYTAHRENGIIVAQWVSIEMALDAANGESPIEALNRSKEIEEQWFKANNIGYPNLLNPDEQQLPIISRSEEDRKIGITVGDIMSCTDLITIDSYRFLIKGKGDLEKAFMKRRKEIEGAEVNTLLNLTEKHRQSQNKK